MELFQKGWLIENRNESKQNFEAGMNYYIKGFKDIDLLI